MPAEILIYFVCRYLIKYMNILYEKFNSPGSEISVHIKMSVHTIEEVLQPPLVKDLLSESKHIALNSSSCVIRSR